MDFTFEFLRVFFAGLFLAAPILLFLVAVIAVLGQLIGRREGWSKCDAFYYSFITATTVGYGDFRPSSRFSKMTAISIAFCGVVLTGFVVAIGLESAHYAFDGSGWFKTIQERLEEEIQHPAPSATTEQEQSR